MKFFVFAMQLIQLKSKSYQIEKTLEHEMVDHTQLIDSIKTLNWYYKIDLKGINYFCSIYTK